MPDAAPPQESAESVGVAATVRVIEEEPRLVEITISEDEVELPVKLKLKLFETLGVRPLSEPKLGDRKTRISVVREKTCVEPTRGTRKQDTVWPNKIAVCAQPSTTAVGTATTVTLNVPSRPFVMTIERESTVEAEYVNEKKLP
jgi:hypothetical protein